MSLSPSTPGPEIAQCHRVLMDVLKDRAADLDLQPKDLDRVAPAAPAAPSDLPMLRLLPEVVAAASGPTAPLCQAILTAAPHLAWRQTYQAADGFDARYLETYGWADLIGPTGAYRAPGLRVMVGYWGQGLVYPNHSHPPEEHYLVLAGEGWFRLGDAPFRRLGPGEIFHTPSHAVHAAEMRDGPLFALSLWRASGADADLGVDINLTDSDRQVRTT